MLYTVLTKNFDFITDLQKNYDSHPVICCFCGEPLSFKKYYNQYENSKRFCSKKCKADYIKETSLEITCDEFCSRTEKTIYTFISLHYPELIITHNLTKILPPYEIDFCIETSNDKNIFIEYNGTLHCSRKKKGTMQRSIEKRKINDKIKKEKLCSERKEKLIRIWSEIGLYSKPEIFNKALKELKLNIDIILQNHIYKDYGLCCEIIIDKNGDIHKFMEKFEEGN